MAAFSGKGWDSVSEVKDGVASVGIMVRYPDGKVIPMGVPAGVSARQYAEIMDAEPGYKVTAVQVAIPNRPGAVVEYGR